MSGRDALQEELPLAEKKCEKISSSILSRVKYYIPIPQFFSEMVSNGLRLCASTPKFVSSRLACPMGGGLNVI
jgi:hypothetical protein